MGLLRSLIKVTWNCALCDANPDCRFATLNGRMTRAPAVITGRHVVGGRGEGPLPATVDDLLAAITATLTICFTSPSPLVSPTPTRRSPTIRRRPRGPTSPDPCPANGLARAQGSIHGMVWINALPRALDDSNVIVGQTIDRSRSPRGLRCTENSI